MISVQEAFDLLAKCKLALQEEEVTMPQALGRILSEDVYADRDYPPFNRAAMDGFAVYSEWFNALDTKKMPNQGICLAGKEYLKPIDKSRALRIMTGAMLPESLDAVVKIEDSFADCDMVTFENLKSVKPFYNVAQKGEDAKKGEVVLRKGTLLNAQNIQLLSTLGVSKVKAVVLPKVAIITTGDEVVGLEEIPQVFQIRNSNLWSLKMLLKQAGFPLVFEQHVLDSGSEIEASISSALGVCDVLLLTGGVSMGDADFVAQSLLNMGIEKIFHKVAIKPGKPIWFGRNEAENKVVFGLPGNPLSAYLDYSIFVKPFLLNTQGNTFKAWHYSVLENEQKSAGIDRFLPFYFEEGKVSTKAFNGSGDITSLVSTEGFVYLEKDKKYSQGDLVKIFPF